MALIKCKDCGHDVSTAAEKCPHCGAPAAKVTAAKTASSGVGLGCLIIIGIVVVAAMVDKIGGGNVNSDLSGAGPQSTDTQNTIVGSADALSSSNPPVGFRDIKWDSALPSIAKLHKTAMKGCATIAETTTVKTTLPCTHLHIDTDDIESFSQQENVPPFLGVAVYGQMLMWSYKKFWSGTVYSKNEGDFATLRQKLISNYGPPTFENGSLRLTKWKWSTPTGKVMIQLFQNDRREVSLHFSRED
jgi:hypothetical protein